MRPSEELTKLVRIMRICAAICGVDIIDKNFRCNGITKLLIFFMIVYYSCVAYTIVSNFSNYIFVLESLSMIGSAIQGSTKLGSALVFSQIYRSQYELLERIYTEYETKGNKYTVVLKGCISRIRIVYQATAFLYFMVFVLIISVPFVLIIVTGRRLLLLKFFFPLVDVDTNFGYAATIVLQVICIIYACAGNFTADMFILMFFAHSALFVDIFRVKTKMLNELDTDGEIQSAGDQLKDIIDWHQTYLNFIHNSDMIFFWVSFIQITTSAMSVALTLVTIIISDWPGSYTYIFLALSMLYLYCGIGTLVEIANDQFTDEIYAIEWYRMTIDQQKLVQFMLMKSQSPKLISVGGVAPLSVSTGLQVTKTVYSFLMMMLNFFS